MDIDAILDAATVIPVLEIEAIHAAAPLATALFNGGLRVVEITLRTDCALDAVKAMQDSAPNLIVGVGTVRTASDVNASLKAGAAFLVSPGASLELLEVFRASDAAALPGVATASEAMIARDFGFEALKFFPAEPAGGVSYLKSLAGPLPDIAFCPTGGISADKAPEYLALANVACVGGSWIASKDDITRENWARIQANAKLAADMQS